MRAAPRLLLLAGLVGFATPAMASDFTPLRVILLGGYVLCSMTLFGLLWLVTRRHRDASWRRLSIAVIGAVLFAPTLMPGPNFFWPAVILLLMGAPEYIGLPTLASLICVGGLLWLLLGPIGRRRTLDDGAG